MTGDISPNLHYLGFMKYLMVLLFTGLTLNSQAEVCEYSQSPSPLEKAIKSKDTVTLAKRTYDATNAHLVQGVRISQILKMSLQVTGGQKSSVPEAIESFDGRKIYRYDFTSNQKLAANFYTVIFAYAGDTEVGSIFEGATDKMVAEMSDGDIKICK